MTVERFLHIPIIVPDRAGYALHAAAGHRQRNIKLACYGRELARAIRQGQLGPVLPLIQRGGEQQCGDTAAQSLDPGDQQLAIIIDLEGPRAHFIRRGELGDVARFAPTAALIG